MILEKKHMRFYISKTILIEVGCTRLKAPIVHFVLILPKECFIANNLRKKIAWTFLNIVHAVIFTDNK